MDLPADKLIWTEKELTQQQNAQRAALAANVNPLWEEFKTHLTDNRQWLLERLAKEKDAMQIREIQGQIYIIDELLAMREQLVDVIKMG